MFLSKLLPPFLMPLGIATALLIAGIIRKQRWMTVSAVVLLWISAMPIVGNGMLRLLNGDQLRMPADSVSPADAIVVLSAGRSMAPGPAKISEWDEADRFFGGIELFRAGKAPLLVFTGGWTAFAPDAALEGEVLAAEARSMGIPADRVLCTERVTNTGEEAQAVARLLQRRDPRPHTILLVTSAFHMSRARPLFERAGLAVRPFPVDFIAEAGPLSVVDFVPTAGALSRTSTAIRELYGRAYYRLGGR
jgi:uncharacterized SAM-binding protein YcdF (DUF218 family)